jgi:hypothetical protein
MSDESIAAEALPYVEALGPVPLLEKDVGVVLSPLCTSISFPLSSTT